VVDAFTEVERADIGAVPFKQDTILEYHIDMSPALYEEMEAHGDDEVYRPASLRVRGGGVAEDFETIGIRYKGDYSLHHCWDDHGGVRSHARECAKLSIKLKLDKYKEAGRFFGLKRICLHAMAEDETKLRERLVYAMFNEFGVTTARTAHAQLYINDQEPLLALAVEQIDGRYTAYHFPEGGDGNLYKETWPTASLLESALLPQLRTNDNPEDEPDVSRFIEFGNVVGAAAAGTFRDDLAPFLDLNQLIRYMAVDRASKNWDGITAFYWPDRPHNLYWYHDIEGSGRFHIIPWDLDKTMWEYDPYMDLDRNTADRPVPDWNVLPLSCDPISVWYGSVYVFPSGCDNFMNLLAATSWDDFVAAGRELLATALQYDAMNSKITAWAEQIAPLVDADPLLNKASWEADVEDFQEILQKSIIDFEAHLEEGYVVEQ
jgi:spore coat protein CotH